MRLSGGRAFQAKEQNVQRPWGKDLLRDNKEVCVAGVEGVRRRVLGKKGREVVQGQIMEGLVGQEKDSVKETPWRV